jgi:hypothetical protein
MSFSLKVERTDPLYVSMSILIKELKKCGTMIVQDRDNELYMVHSVDPNGRPNKTDYPICFVPLTQDLLPALYPSENLFFGKMYRPYEGTITLSNTENVI